MDAREMPLWQWIREAYQFKVPLYQRPYSWDEEDCLKLWDDILQAGQEEKAKNHFVGCIVCMYEGEDQWNWPVLVIDGQQRITTLMLLMEAIARGLEEQEIKGFDKITASGLRKAVIDIEREEDDKYKMILSGEDKSVFMDLVSQRENLEKDKQSRVLKNFLFFRDKLRGLDEKKARQFNRGLVGLRAVTILLSHNDDDPQHVFESMNSKGKDLSGVDLIRNHMLMKLAPKEQGRVYETYWRPMEAHLQAGGGG